MKILFLDQLSGKDQFTIAIGIDVHAICGKKINSDIYLL